MKTRQGFTLIEMLVATALTLFLMTIMSEAFVTALDTFTQLKGIGDMEEGLRTATMNLRYDLSQQLFEGQRRLSDGTLLTSPIQQGFFQLYQGAASSAQEGVDNDLGIPSYVSPAVGPVLHFTVRLQGSRPENFFSTTVPAGGPLDPTTPIGQATLGQLPDALYTSTKTSFNTQWAEVMYFLSLTGSTTSPSVATSYVAGANTPLYGLFRTQLLMPLRSDLINVPGNQAGGTLAQYPNVACSGGAPLTFFSPIDVAANPALRPLNPANPTARASATQVLNNVVSFNVRVMSTYSLANGGFADLVPVAVTNGDAAEVSGAFPGNASFGGFPATYDTATIPAQFSAGQFPQIIALEISIRVWDPSTKQSRQITIIQAM
jgi:prepilin-type N-terminal cleavage/methylation domain-containing protein